MKWVTKKQLRYRIFDMRCLIGSAIDLLISMTLIDPICPKCGHIQSKRAQDAHSRAPKLIMELEEQRRREWNEESHRIKAEDTPA